ncbi:MAG: DUF4139 domain-containing protein [Gemmataceae bacterium]|nr:DUF4139 domain-containing protein [Gemmataceae bacterium]
MIRRKRLWGLTILGLMAAVVGVDRWWYMARAGNDPQADLKPAVALPVTRVVLFNTGVGYFTRGGEVEGDARVDLQFPETDVNDLLKSMVVEDFGGGRLASVLYDARDPAARTLAGFAIDLNDSPTFAQILAQARGEPVEVSAQPTAANQPGKLAGQVVGVENQTVAGGGSGPPVVSQVLNLWCADGLRAVKLSDIRNLRFANPSLEGEFRRALDVLAANHDTQKKAVALQFAGQGRRKVQVGYVVEAPIWKTSYRLALDADGKAKPHLQTWAAVENPSDEDWNGVKLALVGGRPLSFRMDLYTPLYAPRPVVEPEQFAKLRPPTYDPGFDLDRNARFAQQGGQLGLGGGLAGIGGGFGGGFGGGGLVGQGGQAGQLGQFGQNGALMNGNAANPPAPTAVPGRSGIPMVRLRNPSEPAEESFMGERTRFAGEIGRELATRLGAETTEGQAANTRIGDQFQYVVDRPVSLARQKAALIPLLTADVEAERVGIYNPAVLPKNPLLGLRLKNTTGAHLVQGPATVFEGSTYAGDTRLPDLSPGESRLVSYAVDLGTTVEPREATWGFTLLRMTASKGVITTVNKLREAKEYRISNRGPRDRVVLIEHPNRSEKGVRLVDTDKPAEDAKDVYRFRVAVKAGERKVYTVTEESESPSTRVLSEQPDENLAVVLKTDNVPPALRAKVEEAVRLKGAWDAARRAVGPVGAELKRLADDQDRIRKNLAATPKEAEVYGAYLKKLSEQEKRIDVLTARQEELAAAEAAARKAFEDYLANLSD